MHPLRKMENLSIHNVLPPLLAIAGLVVIHSSAQAACYGFPESTAGCTVNGVQGACVGQLTSGDIIIARSCTNPVGTELGNINSCVVRGLGGNDLIIAFTSNTGFGNSGPIIVCGGGNDLILGTTGNDVILGGAGEDILLGGDGLNLLLGGSGNDTLLLGLLGPPPFSPFPSGSNNYNYGGAGERDICQAGLSGLNAKSECEIRLPSP